VYTFAPGFPRLREVVTAARAASRLNDSRFTQVFDVEDDWDHAYIVMEWAAGDSLADMLAPGPLDAARGARIVAEAAEAMSAAHAAGLAHLCMVPDSLRWTPGGGVKITGLGINAALSGTTSDDPALTDTRRLGMLLYAALTGHWPGPDCHTLPSAPLADGLPRSPRQVRAGVPAALDEITCQALLLRDTGDGLPPTTPAQLATTLLAAIPPVAIPQLPASSRSRPDTFRRNQRPARETAYWSPNEAEAADWSWDRQPAVTRPGGRDYPPARQGESSRAKAAVISVLVVAVALGLAVAAYHSLRGGRPASSAAAHRLVAGRSSTAVTALTPVGAQAFEDNPSNANLAIDNDATTAWKTDWYIGNPVFGGLQQGSGLILDMGHAVRLSSVQVTLGSIPGADVQIKIGTPSTPVPPANDPTVAEGIANSMTTVAQQTNVTGTVTFPVSSTATGRYVLIWFTKLPPMAGEPNKYQAEVYHVVVRGSG